MGIGRLRESDVLHQVLDYLAVRHVFAFRLSTGAFFGDHKGKGWAFRSHSLGPGAADILAFGPSGPIWIECKAPRGRQRPSQKVFETLVKDWGHVYLVVRSIDDLAGVI
jgi:hypothetical protein